SLSARGGEVLECLGTVEPAVCEEEVVQAGEHATCLVFRPVEDGPLGGVAEAVQLASELVTRLDEALADERLPALGQQLGVVPGMALAGRRERVGRFG